MPLILDLKTINISRPPLLYYALLVYVGRRTFCDSSAFRNSESLSHLYSNNNPFADSEISKFLNFEFQNWFSFVNKYRIKHSNFTFILFSHTDSQDDVFFRYELRLLLSFWTAVSAFQGFFRFLFFCFHFEYGLITVEAHSTPSQHAITTVEPVSRDQILRHARGQGNINSPCSADHEQDWQPYPVDQYSAIYDDTTYTHTYMNTYTTVVV